MRIAFTYNVKKHTASVDLASQEDLDCDSMSVIQSIKKAIEANNHTCIEVEADSNAFKKLSDLKGQIDIVFNIAEGQYGDARESQIPLLCEILKIPYTHSSPTTHAIGLNKRLCCLALKGAGINIPESVLIQKPLDLKNLKLNFPVIIKPNAEGSSKGVFDANVVDNPNDLAAKVKYISEDFKHDVIVEEFIDGREFTVAVLGNDPVRVLPIVEQRFDFLPKGMKKIASFELKWIHEEALPDPELGVFCPAKLTKIQQELIEETSKKVYRILNCRECSRIDYRFRKGRLYFIEINTLPGINPDETTISYFPFAARRAGIKYNDLVQTIITDAAKRWGLNSD